MQMTQEGNESVTRRRVGIAEHVVATDPAILTTSGLGSCVGICLYDDQGRGGLAHCMLPSADDTEADVATKPAKHVDTGIEILQTELLDAGALRGKLRAKVAGGSDMLGFSEGPTVGERNVAVARAELKERDIPIVATETGGGQGRSLEFETGAARLHVTAADGSSTVL